jgi:hypothetical protein
MRAFLDKAGLIHNPGRHRSGFLYGRQNVIADLPQHAGTAPGRLCDEVVQRLVPALHMIRSQARGDWLDALSFAVQQQAGTVIPQRFGANRRAPRLAPATPNMPRGVSLENVEAVEAGQGAFR